MNGTPDGYTTEISSPGWGFGGGGNSLPPDRMGIAQLSNRMLIAPDGLPFQEGMVGELFGVSCMAFPFPRENKSDESVSTGDQGWMLFINSQNFKGPVAYWTPETWSRLSKSYPVIKGRGLDARPGLMNGGVMEVNQVPFMEANSKGGHYVKIPRIRFPIDEKGETVLMQDVAMYSADALFKPAQQTIQKNEKTSWSFNLIGRFEPKLSAEPILLKHAARKGEAIGELNTGMPIEGIERVVQTKILGSSGNQAFGLKWVKGREWGALPEYFLQEGEKMKVLEISQVPKECGLLEKSFDSPSIPRPYTSPDEKDGQWGTPGPKAGPFTVNLTDGSQVTYSWYRFVDQPSIVALGWSEEERNRLQSLIEKFHAEWARTENFMPLPSRGKLASVDPALMVVPPQGLEAGYVPIVTKQSLKP